MSLIPTSLTLTIPFPATFEQTRLIPSRHLPPPRAFLHKRNAQSRVHATVRELRELSKSDPGQPMFSVWGRWELGRRMSFFSCHPWFLSILLPLFAFRVSSVAASFISRKDTKINWGTTSFLISSFSFPHLNSFIVTSIRRLIPTTSELSRFIAAGRLYASINKAHGIVETTRQSLKNAQYETVGKQGDVLLNEVQRLSKVFFVLRSLFSISVWLYFAACDDGIWIE